MDDDIDPQAKAVLEARKSVKLPGGHTLSVETYREQFRDLLATQSSEPVETVRDFSVPGPATDIPLRVYDPGGCGPLPVVVFFHGGGWVLGGLDCYDNLCTRVANRAECLLVSVDYRLAPEHPFPAAVKDSYAATAWVEENAGGLGGDPERVAVAGPSAGGNLATVVSLMARDRDGPDLTHQYLLYPSVNPAGLREFESHRTYAEGYGLTRASLHWFADAYCPDPVDKRNVYAFPLQASDLSGLPPATILSAEYDPLRDEAFAYEKRLEADGVDVSHHHYGTMIHDFLSRTDEIDTAVDGIGTVADDLTEAFEQ